MQAWQISLMLAAVLAIAEVLTLSFILLGLSVGMVLVATVQYWSDGFQAGRDLAIFALGSLIAVLIFRMLFRKKRDLDRTIDEDVNRY
jgi:membrane protein implicated in regulation of membrane protease activity